MMMKDKKEIEVMSCMKFKETMAGFELFDSNIEQQDLAIISICDTSDYNIDNFYFDNSCHSHWFLENHPNVLNINFDDCTPEECEGHHVYAMTEKQAEEIYKFISNNTDKSKFIVHCSAGISRSGAVGMFLRDFFISENFVVNLHHNGIMPNPYVSRLLNRYLYERN